jgi:DNA polymerase III subunit epsilon
MNWLRRLLRRTPVLDAEQAQALAAYHARPAITDNSPLKTLRCVVVDVETTGLNPFTDRLISIGAVKVVSGKVRLPSAFEIVLCQQQPSTRANILIHGIDGTTQLTGQEPAAALLKFLDYAGKAPLIGFHAGFDRMMIDRACMDILGITTSNTWLDLAYLAPALFNEPGKTMPEQGLDNWLRRFGIENDMRHNALADAVATAQLLQVILAQAIVSDANILADLSRIEQDQRWLRQI